MASEKFERDEVVVISTNIDDCSGEILGHVFDLLMAAGAFDVSLHPILMKKNRSGTMLQVIASETKLETLAEIILTETTAFGLRYEKVQRLKLRQEVETIQIPYGNIRVKKGFLGNKLVQVSPEYEDCRKLAAEKKIPIKNIYAAVNALVER